MSAYLEPINRLWRTTGDGVWSGFTNWTFRERIDSSVKVFVSAQIEEKEAARKAFAAFEGAGMSITHDWTTTDAIGDKFRRRDEAGDRARKDIDGVVNCDIYVLLADNRKVGKGMYVELGAALALRQTMNRPEIFIVGPINHSSIFYLHPFVKHLDTVEDVLLDLSSR